MITETTSKVKWQSNIEYSSPKSIEEMTLYSFLKHLMLLSTCLDIVRACDLLGLSFERVSLKSMEGEERCERQFVIS